jgi:hypothetical protein
LIPNTISYSAGEQVLPAHLTVKKRETGGAWSTVNYSGGSGFTITHAPFTANGRQMVTITVNNYPSQGQTTTAPDYPVYVDTNAVPIYSNPELIVFPSKNIYDYGEYVDPALDVYKRDIYGKTTKLSYLSNPGFSVSPAGAFTTPGEQTVSVSVSGYGSAPAVYKVWVTTPPSVLGPEAMVTPKKSPTIPRAVITLLTKPPI